MTTRKAKPAPEFHAMSVKVETSLVNRMDRLKVGNRTSTARRAIQLYTEVMEMRGINHWGLDVGYARTELMHLVSNLDSYTPAGFKAAVARIAAGANKSVSDDELERINEEY